MSVSLEFVKKLMSIFIPCFYLVVLSTACKSTDIAVTNSLKSAAHDVVWENTFQDLIALPIMIIEDTAIVKTTSSISRIDLATGETVWEHPSDGVTDFQVFLASSETDIFVPERNGCISSYSLDTGTLVWRECERCLTGCITSLAFHENKVFVARNQVGISVYNADDGTVIWSLAAPSRGIAHITLSDNGEFLYHSGRSSFLTLDASNGGTVFERDGWSGRVEVAHDGDVYLSVASQVFGVRKLNPLSGETDWYTTIDNVDLSTMYVTQLLNEVYITAGSTLIALDKQTGNTIWAFESSDATVSLPTTTSDFIVTRDNHNIYFLQPEDGTLIRDITTSDSNYTHPLPITVTDETNLLIPVSNTLYYLMISEN